MVVPRYQALLAEQRRLYSLPRGRARFEEYLLSMLDAARSELRLPLQAMNPMGREHVPARLDEWLALDADGEAGRATASARVPDALAGLRVCLVLADDAAGAWTNRCATEFSDRFESRALLERGWCVGLLWTSQAASAREAREAALAAVHRAVLVCARGQAVTLGEMLEQEGVAMARAGRAEPSLEPAVLSRVRSIVEPRRGARDRATQLACLFGDVAARELGHEPLGVPPFGGLALALAAARKSTPA